MQKRYPIGAILIIAAICMMCWGSIQTATQQQLLDDIAYALGFELYDLVVYETFVSAHDSLHGESVEDRAARHRAYCGVHARGVAARGQDADTFDSGHTLLCF